MIYTTLNAIRAHHPCGIRRNDTDGFRKLLNHLGKTEPDDEPLSFLTILDSNGLDDALWCLRALPAEWDNAIRLLVCDLVEPAMKYTTDPRSQTAVDTARRFARGEATEEELAAACDAAWDAALDAYDAAWAAARNAARAEQERIFRVWLDAQEQKR